MSNYAYKNKNKQLGNVADKFVMDSKHLHYRQGTVYWVQKYSDNGV